MSKINIRAGHAFTLGLLSGLFWALFEILLLAMDSTSESWGITALHILCFNAIFGILLGGVTSLTLPSISHYKPFSWQWIGLNLEISQRQHYCSVALSLLLCSLPYTLILWVSTQIAHGFNRMLLVGAWGAFAGLLALMITASIWSAVFRISSMLIKRIFTQGQVVSIPISVIPTVVMLLGIVSVFYKVMQLPLGAYQLDGFYMIIASIPLYVALALLLHGWLSRRDQWIPAIVISVMILGVSLWTFPQWQASHISGRLIPQQAKLSHLMLNVFRTLTDDDADGYSDAFGGGDCDDTQATINPSAKDIPENGIDENCMGGDARNPPPPKPPVPVKKVEKAHRWNVVFLLVDTLRASHLDLYGYDRKTMPNLTKFAQNAVVFDRAFAHAPRTPFSIPSILIGRYPSRIDWVKRFSDYSKLTNTNETMFERFQTAGWRTEAMSAHWYFGKKKNVNLNQGLDLWDNKGALSISESNTQSAAAMITKKVQTRLQALSQDKTKPFFLFAHYFAPHGKYMLHAPKCKRSKKWCHVEPRCQEHPTQCSFGDPKARSVNRLINAYDSELAYTDVYLSDIFNTLKELQLDQNTIIVITSDHGESFKDRKPKYLFHGRSVYNEELHVPLIIKTPQSKAQRRSDIVGLVDLSPTLSTLTGVTYGKVDGLSLDTLLGDSNVKDERKQERDERILYLEQLPYPGHKVHMTAAINAQGFKVIRNLTNNQTALYELSKDWEEKKNLIKTEGKKQSKLLHSLNQFLEATP
jgi:arylsulfatase A-like enzyme